MDIMLDLETLSSASDAAIVSIGAVTFNNQSQAPSRFYVEVDPKSSQACGGRVDASTVQWWITQSEEARSVLNCPDAIPIEVALGLFAEYCGQWGRPRVWGNGAAFDNVVLRSAYDRASLKAPWSFSDERCYRTLKNLRKDIPFFRKGVAHNALADAIDQAEHAQRILDTLGRLFIEI